MISLNESAFGVDLEIAKSGTLPQIGGAVRQARKRKGAYVITSSRGPRNLRNPLLAAGAVGAGTAAGLKLRERKNTKVDDEAIAKLFNQANLPGDNGKAKDARDRRKAGLGVAGGGYLVASRSGDVAPGAADLLARSPKKIGAAEHKVIVDRRAAKIKRHGGRIGAALTGAGLVLAGEGAVSDLRHRDAFNRGGQQAREHIGKSAFGVDHELAKYDRGSITYHHEQSNLHSRKKTAADKRTKAGVATATAGVSGGVALHSSAPSIGHLWHGEGKTGDEFAAKLKTIRQIKRVGVLGGAGVAAAGLGLAAQGAASRSRHAQQQNAHTKKAQLARQSRNSALGKAFKAFDSEQSRHDRQVNYSGAATGGAVVAAGGGVAAGQRARVARRTSAAYRTSAAVSNADLADRLKTAAAPNARTGSRGGKAALAAHETAQRHTVDAGKFASKAKKLSRISRGSALGAAALSAAAVGVRNYDRRDQRRSSGY